MSEPWGTSTLRGELEEKELAKKTKKQQLPKKAEAKESIAPERQWRWCVEDGDEVEANIYCELSLWKTLH